MADINDYQKINGRDSYINLFQSDAPTDNQPVKENIQKNALNAILDIRKFEIELFWKRTTFFWTTNAAIIAGYFTLFSKTGNAIIMLFPLGCLGVLFSLAWYFANRGSKFWQVNWEKHLDCIEDEIIGPLYKTTIDSEYYRLNRFWNLLSPYPFSVSKITQFLSLALIVFWMFLLYILVNANLPSSICYWNSNLTFCLITFFATLIGVYFMYRYTHTGFDKYSRSTEDERRVSGVHFEKRGLKN